MTSELARAQDGDETAFLLVYERHKDAVFRFAYRMLGSIELAEDITHDCFLSLIQNGRRYDPNQASLRTYLLAAARNLALKHYRRSRMIVDSETVEAEPSSPESEQPIFVLLQKELTAEIIKAIKNLPDLQREALVLFEYEEIALAEIAAIVGADVGTVKSRLFRAREGLRKSLKSYWQSDRSFVVVDRS